MSSPKRATSTHGGGVDQTAVIGHAPEHRSWRPGDPAYAPMIARTARVEAYATVDAGVTESTCVGEGAWLMKHVHVGHDARVGARCELAPGTVVGGGAVLECDVHCGIGVLVLPYVHVGHGARLGAGAVVTKDVPPGETWVGNPARRLLRRSDQRDQAHAQDRPLPAGATTGPEEAA